MKVIDLYNEVAGLGFETELEYKDAFFYAVNAALHQINRIRPKYGMSLLNTRSYPSSVLGDISKGVLNSFAPLVVLSPSAYSFKVLHGRGALRIEKEVNGQWELYKEVPYAPIVKGIIEDNITARFVFNNYGVVGISNFAIYKDVPYATAEEVPIYDKYVAFDMSTLTSDFLSFDSNLFPYQHIASQYYFVQNSTIYLRYEILSLLGEGLHVSYLRKPTEIDKGNVDIDNIEIDLDSDLAKLLPLLVASRVWADDEPAKAEYYLTLYREQEARIRHQDRMPKHGTVITGNRW